MALFKSLSLASKEGSVKCFLHKHRDLSSVPKAYVVEENCLFLISNSALLHTLIHACTHTHTLKCFKQTSRVNSASGRMPEVDL